MRALVLSAAVLIAASAGTLAQPSPPPYPPQPYAPQPEAPQPYARQPYAPQPYATQPDAPQPYSSGGSVVLSPLPSPDVTQDNLPSDYLRAAQGALAAGRNGEAQQALEMAQTRMLDRSVPLGQTNNPSDNPTVKEISRALRALAARDRAGCMQSLQTALTSATAQGL